MLRLTHGLRSRRLIENTHPDIGVWHVEQARAIAADLGDDLTTLGAAAVRETARLVLICDSLATSCCGTA